MNLLNRIKSFSLVILFSIIASVYPTNTIAASGTEGEVLVESISSGAEHSCSISESRSLLCWGSNYFGQINVPGDLGEVIQVSSGEVHTCAVTQSNQGRCWGSNSWGQSAIPNDLGTIKQISAGSFHTCAVTTSSLPRCWGLNNGKQISIPKNLGTIKQISAGENHTCAVKTNGQVQCWGGWKYTNPKNLGITVWLSTGKDHNCAISSLGIARCWGGNGFGQASVPPDLGFVKSISAGDFYTCATRNDGSLRCWGTNIEGQAPTLESLESLKQISSGRSHTCALTVTDKIICWGYGGNGRTSPPGIQPVVLTMSLLNAGNDIYCGTTTTNQVRCWGFNSPKNLGQVLDLSTGRNHACAINLEGAAICWGNNSSNQSDSSDGPYTQVSSGDRHTCAIWQENQRVDCWGGGNPYQGGFDANYGAYTGRVSQVSAGKDFTCARTTEDVAKCWGPQARSVPSNLGEISQISAGENHVCVKTLQNTTKCWGDNSYGQITVPNNLGEISYVSAGANHTCAITVSSSVQCWGGQSYGQSTVPSDIGSVSSLNAGTFRTCAVKSSGEPVCWGRLASGVSLRESLLVFPPPIATPSLLNHSGVLKVSVGGLYENWTSSYRFGNLTWMALDAVSGEVLCRSDTGDCTLTNSTLGETYNVKVVSSNEYGSSPEVFSEAFRNCPDNPSISTSPNTLRPPTGGSITVVGGLTNLCPTFPRVVSVREKVYGKNWGPWKNISLDSNNAFTFTRKYTVATRIQYKAMNGTKKLVTFEESVHPVRKALSFSASAKSISNRQGFNQGGTITFNVSAPSNFTGSCVMQASTDYAFNFALTYMGSEVRRGKFTLKNGKGSGRLTTRWNGEFSATVLCTSGAFPEDDYSAGKTVWLRANF